jgi:probable selenium-dependent hydroxylase accessory protein YqeC
MGEAGTSFSRALGLRGGGVVSLVGAGGKTTLLFRLAGEMARRGESVLTTTTTRMMRPSAEQCSAVLLSPSVEELLRVSTGLPAGNLHVFAASGAGEEPDKVAGFGREAVAAFWESGVFRWILVEADGAARRPLKAPAAHEPVVPEITRWVVGVAGLSGLGRPLDERWVFRPEKYSEITGLPLGALITPASVATVMVHERGVMARCPPQAIRCVFLNQADLPGCAEAGRRVAHILAGTKERPPDRVVVGNLLPEPGEIWPAGN